MTKTTTFCSTLSVSLTPCSQIHRKLKPSPSKRDPSQKRTFGTRAPYQYFQQSIAPSHHRTMPPRQVKSHPLLPTSPVYRATDLHITIMDLATVHQAILLVLLFSMLLSLLLLFASEEGRLKPSSQPLLRRRDCLPAGLVAVVSGSRGVIRASRQLLR